MSRLDVTQEFKCRAETGRQIELKEVWSLQATARVPKPTLAKGHKSDLLPIDEKSLDHIR